MRPIGFTLRGRTRPSAPPPTHRAALRTQSCGAGGAAVGATLHCAGGIPAPGVASKSPQSLHPPPPPAAHPPWKRLLLHRFLLHPRQRRRSQPHTDPAAAPSKLIASGSGALKGDGGGSRSRAGGCAMQSSSHGGPRPGASGRSSQQDAHPHSFLLLQPLARRSHTKILLCRMHRFTTRGLRRPPPHPRATHGTPHPNTTSPSTPSQPLTPTCIHTHGGPCSDTLTPVHTRVRTLQVTRGQGGCEGGSQLCAPCGAARAAMLNRWSLFALAPHIPALHAAPVEPHPCPGMGSTGGFGEGGRGGWGGFGVRRAQTQRRLLEEFLYFPLHGAGGKRRNGTCGSHKRPALSRGAAPPHSIAPHPDTPGAGGGAAGDVCPRVTLSRQHRTAPS